MIKSFAFADMKNRYTGSFGGLFWSLIHPLFVIFTYYIIFSYVFGMKVRADYGTPSYSLWLVGGVVPWFFFNETISRATGALHENSALITKTLFPSEIIPLSLLVSGIINHLIGLLILFIFVFVVTGGISPLSWLVVVYFMLLSLMILGMSWALSSLNVFIRDINQMVGIAMNLWFYYTPIFYPINIVPEKIRFLFKINPMYHVVGGYRDCLISGKLPDPYHLLYLTFFSISIFILGGLLYKRLKPAFADVM